MRVGKWREAIAELNTATRYLEPGTKHQSSRWWVGFELGRVSWLFLARCMNTL